MSAIFFNGTEYANGGGGGGGGSLPSGGTAGQVLTKQSATEGDADWETKERFLTQAEYNALSTEEKNNGTIYYITDAGSQDDGKYLKYSTSEQVVGSWVDGADIYKITIINNNPTWDSMRWVFTDITALNFDKIVDIEGFCTVKINSSDTTFYQQFLPRIVPDAVAGYSIGIGDIAHGTGTGGGDRVGVLFGTSYYSVGMISLTLYYTKRSA